VKTLEDLRRFAVGRSLFPPTTLKRALDKMGFVQADPIRAPARAQDLTLRHRVNNYRAGDLERRYAELAVEEDFFVSYGFVTRSLQALMHPRQKTWTEVRGKQARLVLEFVRERGEAHPREVEERFSLGTVKNNWGGSSNTTTMLLDSMHYRGLLRVTRREGGIRVYAIHEHSGGPSDPAARRARIDALVDAVVHVYAPLPLNGLSSLVSRLRYAAPQWRGELKAALERAKNRMASAEVAGATWYWPAGETAGVNNGGGRQTDAVRLLAPFDPLVWDRARFEMLWGWAYRFEAYTPIPKRKLGYYALPLLWRDHVIGWGNLTINDGRLNADLGYVKSPPRDGVFKRELDSELDRMRTFLRLQANTRRSE